MWLEPCGRQGTVRPSPSSGRTWTSIFRSGILIAMQRTGTPRTRGRSQDEAGAVDAAEVVPVPAAVDQQRRGSRGAASSNQPRSEPARVEVRVRGGEPAAPRARAPAARPPAWAQHASNFFRGLWRCIPRAAVAPVVLVIAIAYSGQAGPIQQVTRVLAAVANVAEGGAKMTLTGLESTGNVSQNVAVWARGVVSSGQDLTSEMWAGIDLVNASVMRRYGAVATASGAHLAGWLRSELGAEASAMPLDARRQIAASVESINLFLPVINWERELFTTDAQYASLRLSARLLRSGFVEVRWTWISATFEVIWANPLWDVVGFPADAETSQITYLVQKLMENTPALDMPLNFSVVTDFPVSTAITVHARRLFYQMCFFFASPPPGGMP